MVHVASIRCFCVRAVGTVVVRVTSEKLLLFHSLFLRSCFVRVTSEKLLFVFHSLLHPLMWAANKMSQESLLSAVLFIWSYNFEPVQSLISSTHVPRLPSRLPSIVVSRVSQCPDVFLIFVSRIRQLYVFRLFIIVVSFTLIEFILG